MKKQLIKLFTIVVVGLLPLIVVCQENQKIEADNIQGITPKIISLTNNAETVWKKIVLAYKAINQDDISDISFHLIDNEKISDKFPIESVGSDTIIMYYYEVNSPQYISLFNKNNHITFYLQDFSSPDEEQTKHQWLFNKLISEDPPTHGYPTCIRWSQTRSEYPPRLKDDDHVLNYFPDKTHDITHDYPTKEIRDTLKGIDDHFGEVIHVMNVPILPDKPDFTGSGHWLKMNNKKYVYDKSSMLLIYIWQSLAPNNFELTHAELSVLKLRWNELNDVIKNIAWRQDTVDEKIPGEVILCEEPNGEFHRHTDESMVKIARIIINDGDIVDISSNSLPDRQWREVITNLTHN